MDEDEDEDELPLVVEAKKKETQPVDTVDTGSATGGQGNNKTFSRGCPGVL